MTHGDGSVGSGVYVDDVKKEASELRLPVYAAAHSLLPA